MILDFIIIGLLLLNPCILFFLAAGLYFQLIKLENSLKLLTPRELKAFITFMGKKVEKMDLKVNDQLPVALVLEDKFGNVVGAPADAPAWTVADPSMGAVVAAADGLSATFTPSGKLGATQLQALAQIDGKSVQGILDLNLIAGDASQIVLQPGTPVAI